MRCDKCGEKLDAGYYTQQGGVNFCPVCGNTIIPKITIERAFVKVTKFLHRFFATIGKALRKFTAAMGWQLSAEQPASLSEEELPQQMEKLDSVGVGVEEYDSSKPPIGGVYKFAGVDWRVLYIDAQENKALLISEKVLEERPYNDEYEETTWEKCTLRKYLNGEFYNKLGEEKNSIAETHNTNEDNPQYGTTGGNATVDKVFLLSLEEVCSYFGNSAASLKEKGIEGNDY